MNKKILPALMLLLIPVLLHSSSTSAEADRKKKEKSHLQGRASQVTEPIFGGQMHIAEWGDKKNPSVVLVHGIGSDASRVWNSLAAALQRDYHLLVFDLPGFGKSGRLNRLYSPDKYADLVKWIIDTRADGKAALIGHSMGATISLHCAGKYPDAVTRLVVADAAGILHRVALVKSYMSTKRKKNILDGPERILDYWAKNMVEKFDKKFMPKRLDQFLKNRLFRKNVLQSDPQKTAGLALINFNITDSLLKIKQPVYIIWGKKDTVAPMRSARVLTWMVKTSELKIMHDCGHTPMEDKADRFNSLVIQNLQKEPEKLKEKKSFKNYKKETLELKGLKDITLTGIRAKKITLSSCVNLVLKNVEAESLVIKDSTVSLFESRIKGKENAVEVKNSILNMTGFTVSGVRGFNMYNSSVDLAGGSITAQNEALISGYKTSLVLSVCRISSKKNRGVFHRAKTLYAGEGF